MFTFQSALRENNLLLKPIKSLTLKHEIMKTFEFDEDM